jgi:predicted esterase
MTATKIHEVQPVITHGTPLEDADVAVIMLHGRGASAQDIMLTAHQLPEAGVAYLAPQAANNTWYPNSGFGPLAANEPYLSSAVATITGLVEQARAAGIPTDKIVLGGFSQGACLASEYVAAHAAPYGGLFVLSGALMGPDDRDRDYGGSLDGVPVFIGGQDNDTWVRPAQFELTRDVLAGMGADVTTDIISGSAHTIRPSEVKAVRGIIDQLL